MMITGKGFESIINLKSNQSKLPISIAGVSFQDSRANVQTDVLIMINACTSCPVAM